MEAQDFISLFLPSFVSENFDAVRYEADSEIVNIYLDEKHITPLNGQYLSKGFTPATTIQDFPIRGKRVYLHIRRRKWLDKSTGQIITHNYDLTHSGTDLTHDFVAFLKATN